MFAPAPDVPDMGDLQPLSDAIDELCEILHGDREAVIEGLAEIVRRRAEFEDLRTISIDRRSTYR
ncbi:hypothetical protein [Methylobacterium isbiliense]|jgi:hypothetical protein|uniref:Uncharacterized protein n=1 Tax=Methylobacterium isbiliense TaxID=315478 RepID=A0ABQ4SGH9_9HYPH|nr:hypothetical protein [Methylobacterium isbiliense]MDN3626015.1 hypothetical protein [Methylobacterium isbiliense]GJE02336.1 hypothetical protein GMJLKIPL_4283 [Methylobacterium isbiliense]